jgi:hypothetical protein
VIDLKLGGKAALPATHYAAGWKIEGQGVIKPLEEINRVGRRYAELPAELPAGEDRMRANPEKQELLLELCQCFHPYLMKYLVMICRGHVPVVGHGARPFRVNKDVEPFLLYFLPKGQQLNLRTMNTVVRHFHLAFKGMETEEIYDVLMEHLVNVINKYDPEYTEKVKRVVETINNELSKRRQFSIVDVNRYVEFDSDRHIRLLCRRGYLESVKGGKEKRISGFTRGTAWPPPPEFFRSGAIGVACYIQKLASLTKSDGPEGNISAIP